MKVLCSVKDVRDELRGRADTLALIPTMGALHPGHLSLIDIARNKAQKVMVYIFVNPTQFNNPEDLKNYPRDIEKDIQILREQGVDYVFTPSVDDIYGGNKGTKVNPCVLGEVMEGPNRPGHFQGVCTVLSIIFNIVKPDFAVFGEKDFQQMRIVEEMVSDMRLGLEILRAPISREDSGLARSSRNELLTSEERSKASIIYDSLSLANEMVKSGDKDTSKILRSCKQILDRVPELRLEYLTINKEDDLLEVEGVEQNIKHRIFFAGYLGRVRLIDNMPI
jgi:pantoate--beta-alanine ligase